MITIEQAARRVSADTREKNEVFIDPATIMLICSILSVIFSAMRLWCEWRNNRKPSGENIREVCIQKPMWVKRRVNRIVKKKLDDETYREKGQHIVESIFNAGASSTPEELQYLYDNNHQDEYYTNRFGQQEKEL